MTDIDEYMKTLEELVSQLCTDEGKKIARERAIVLAVVKGISNKLEHIELTYTHLHPRDAIDLAERLKDYNRASIIAEKANWFDTAAEWADKAGDVDKAKKMRQAQAERNLESERKQSELDERIKQSSEEYDIKNEACCKANDAIELAKEKNDYNKASIIAEQAGMLEEAADLAAAAGDASRAQKLYRAELEDRLKSEREFLDNHSSTTIRLAVNVGEIELAIKICTRDEDFIMIANSIITRDINKAIILYDRAGQHNLASVLLEKCGDWQKIFQAYEQSGLIESAADMIKDKQGIDEAIKYLEKENNCKYNYAEELAKKAGNKEKAKEMHKKCLEQQLQNYMSDSPDIRCNRIIGGILEELGDKDRAREFYKKSMIDFEQNGDFECAAKSAEKAGDMEKAQTYRTLVELLK